jgi:hypothetical protein
VGQREPGRTEIEWKTSALSYADDVNIVGEKINTKIRSSLRC